MAKKERFQTDKNSGDVEMMSSKVKSVLAACFQVL